MGIHLAYEVSKRSATTTDDSSPSSFEDEYDEESCSNERNKSLDGEWKTAIKKHPHIGLFTLAYMHDCNNLFLKYAMKFLLLVTPAVQLMLAFTLALYPIKHEAEALSPLNCPSRAHRFERVVVGGIGWIYFLKSIFFLLKNTNKNLSSVFLATTGDGSPTSERDLQHVFSFLDRLFTPNRHIEEERIEPFIERGEDGGFIQVFYNLDRGAELGFVPLIYVINLFIIFNTIEPIEMVVNSLAIEFISLLDDNVKIEYLTYFRIDGIAWTMAAAGGTSSSEQGEESSSSRKIATWQLWLLVHPVTVISLFTMIACFSGSLLIAPFYLPYCKPIGMLE